MAAVAGSSPARETKHRLVEALRHERFPCPARGLEFVLYCLDAVRTASPQAAFELNLNTGERMPFRVDYEPRADEEHWFPIDRSILRERGVALSGPPPSEVFAPLPRGVLLQLVLDSIRWHAGGAARADDTVLNASRAWRFSREGVWSSKPDAGAWALTRGAPAVVAEALAARGRDGQLDMERVRRFVAFVAADLEASLAV